MAERVRRRYFVNVTFQWRYAAMIGLAVAVATGLGSLLVFLKLHEQARMRIVHPEGSIIAVTSVVVLFSIGLSALVGALAAWGSIVLSRRICGPLYVLGRYFDQLQHGRLPYIRPLRRNDEFKPLLESFRAAMTEVASRQEQIGQCLDGMLRDLDQLQPGAADRAPLLSELRAKLEQGRRQLLGEPAARVANGKAAATNPIAAMPGVSRGAAELARSPKGA